MAKQRGRPALPDTKKLVPLTFRVSPKTRKDLQKLAEVEQINFSELLRIHAERVAAHTPPKPRNSPF